MEEMVKPDKSVRQDRFIEKDPNAFEISDKSKKKENKTDKTESKEK